MSGGRIVGLGQPHAGDDGVGLAVVAHLRERGVDRLVELHEALEPLALVPLLRCAGPVVIVDALLDASPGSVRPVDLDAIDHDRPCAASSHGLGLAQAIALARVVAGDGFTPRLHLVGVTIRPPTTLRGSLSQEIAAAVPRAAALALALAQTSTSTQPSCGSCDITPHADDG